MSMMIGLAPRRVHAFLMVLTRVVGRWQAGFAARRRVYRTAHALAQLDDRTLHDLGLGRSEVYSAAVDVECADDGRMARRRGGQSFTSSSRLAAAR